MMNFYKRLLPLFILVICFSLTGCGVSEDSSGDDDDDDNYAFSDLADAVFVVPNYHYADSPDQIATLLDSILDAGTHTVIWQWTLLHEKTCYPSDVFDHLDGMKEGDLIGSLLTHADERGMSVYLGLSAGRRPNELYSDPIGPEVDRTSALVRELAARYISHESLAGFYIPYHFINAPNVEEQELLIKINIAAHEALPEGKTLLSAGYPGPDQKEYTLLMGHNGFYPGMSQDDIDDTEKRSAWAKGLVWSLTQSGVDVLLLKTMMGNYKNTFDEAQLDYESVIEEVRLQKSPLHAWAQIDLYDAVNPTGLMKPVLGPATDERINYQKKLAEFWDLPTAGFSWDNYINEEGDVAPPNTVTDPELLEKALIIEEHVRSRAIRAMNVVTVINGQQPLDQFHNLWQEDACWITGLLCGAESFRCAVTGEEDTCDYASALWRSLHRFANVTPLKGEVVRNYVRYFYGQNKPVKPDSDTIKRWHKHPDEEVWWAGDISVDQLSGYFFGLVTYYNLVATDEERAIIEEDVSNIIGLAVANDFKFHEYNGKNTTFGDLRSVPELATTWLVMAYRMTGDETFLDAFYRLLHLENIDWRLIVFHQIMHGVGNFSGQHFHDSGLRHLYEFLPDDHDAFRRLIWGMEYVFQGSYEWGNAMANFTYQAHVPDTAAAARCLHDHFMYDPDHLMNNVWNAEVNRDFGENYIPMEWRTYDEWDWTYNPYGLKNPRGGINNRYPGVSYLVTYWEGRWHGWIP